jgi:hypothetical protein
MAEEIGLPKGWEIKINGSTGKAYFFDTVNKKSHVRMPDAKPRPSPKTAAAACGTGQVPSPPLEQGRPPIIQRKSQPSPPDAVTLAVAKVSSRWTRHLDAATGKPCYLDLATNTLQWTVPDGFVELTKTNGAIRLARRWERRYNSQGKAYYVDHLNRTTQYKIPLGFIEPEKEAELKGHKNAQSASVAGSVEEEAPLLAAQKPAPIATPPARTRQTPTQKTKKPSFRERIVARGITLLFNDHRRRVNRHQALTYGQPTRT